METNRASVINSSALYMHDRAAERGLAFFEELLRDFHPRNFAIRLWDGSSLVFVAKLLIFEKAIV
jgi:hypothetical protein